MSYCAAVKELSGGDPALSEAAKEELARRMEAYLPHAPLKFMIRLGADAVSAELAGARRKAA